MNFFKKLFSKNSSTLQGSSDEIPFKAVVTEEYFNDRYTPEPIDRKILDGGLKMIDSFFIESKIEREVKTPLNHPKNLDKSIYHRPDFLMYCTIQQLDENFVMMVLATVYSDFIMKDLGFKMYKDSKPEFPLRALTLIYDKDGVQLSLYPLEFATKVINHEAKFNDLYERVKRNLSSLKEKKELLNKFMGK